jgi:hypothetical protein
MQRIPRPPFDIFCNQRFDSRGSSHLARFSSHGIGYHSRGIFEKEKAMSTVAAKNLVEAHEYDGDELVRRATLERRSCERKSVAIHARVTVPGMSVLPGHTVDMSLTGASITVPFELAHGQECLIDLELEACGQSSTFHIPGEVRYCVRMGNGRFRAGVRFGDMDAATSAFIETILKTPV